MHVTFAAGPVYESRVREFLLRSVTLLSVYDQVWLTDFQYSQV